MFSGFTTFAQMHEQSKAQRLMQEEMARARKAASEAEGKRKYAGGGKVIEHDPHEFDGMRV